jgi:hypothetical protein
MGGVIILIAVRLAPVCLIFVSLITLADLPAAHIVRSECMGPEIFARLVRREIIPRPDRQTAVNVSLAGLAFNAPMAWKSLVLPAQLHWPDQQAVISKYPVIMVIIMVASPIYNLSGLDQWATI